MMQEFLNYMCCQEKETNMVFEISNVLKDRKHILNNSQENSGKKYVEIAFRYLLPNLV